MMRLTFAVATISILAACANDQTLTSSASISLDQKILDEKAHAAFLNLPVVKNLNSSSENHLKFTQNYAQLKNVRLHYVTLGRGKPILLVHGYPQTWYAWRKLMPLLANDYLLIAPDTRGLGDSSRPPTGYDKKQVAEDLWLLMHEVLKYEKFAVVGHDWGVQTAFHLAADYPQNVTHLVALDVPIMGVTPARNVANYRYIPWYVLFHQIPNFPEALTQGRERLYLAYFLTRGTLGKVSAIEEVDLAEYVRTYSQHGAMQAGFNYYRGIRNDIENTRATLADGFKLPMPCLGIVGGVSSTQGDRDDRLLKSLRRVCRNRVEGGIIPHSGHFFPEEKPQELAVWLKTFLAKP